MGRVRKKRNRPQRDYSIITDPSRVLRPSYGVHNIYLRLTRPLIKRSYQHEDRRRFHPGKRPLYKKDGRPVTFRQVPPKNVDKKRDATKDRIGFSDAYRVVICTQRRARRVALFAKGKIGRGIQLKTRRMLKPHSGLRC